MERDNEKFLRIIKGLSVSLNDNHVNFVVDITAFGIIKNTSLLQVFNNVMILMSTISNLKLIPLKDEVF